MLFITSCGFNLEKDEYIFINEPSTGDPILLNSDSRSQDSLSSLGGVSAKISNNKLFPGNSKCASSSLVYKTFKSGFFEWTSLRNWLSEVVNQIHTEYNFENCDEFAEAGTYEHAASTVLNQIQSVEQLLLTQTDLLMPKVNLRIVPLIKQKIRKVEGKTVKLKDDYLVNNAFFLPQRKEIVFVPQGTDQDGRIPFNSIPLWNIPFVPSHEYGHHIFNELLAEKANKKAHICFNQKKHRTINSSVSNAKLMAAINEGFADLVGQISSGDSFSFDGVSCFEKSRDVNSSKFYDGKDKILTESVLNEFIYPRSISYRSNCNFTDYSQIHHFGAVVAYGLYSTMKENDLLNLRSVTQWAKQLKESYEIHKTVEDNLNDILVSFLDVVDHTQVLKVCDSLKHYFPVLNFKGQCN